MNFTVDLHDYTPVSRDMEKLEEDQRAALAEALGAAYGDEVDRFCLTVKERLETARAKDIHLLNDVSEKAPTVIALYQNEWWTQGYVGVIQFSLEKQGEAGAEPVQVTVNFHSRFDRDNDSRFLMYVFEKAFSARGKIYDDMKIQGQRESTWDYLLLLLFVRQLHDAMKKGMYRQYREYDDNDSNVRGRIDVSRHIRENLMLSNGKIAYTTREYTVDNMVNVLLLKAFACLEKKYPAQLRRLVAQDETVKKGLLLLRAEIETWQDISNRQVLKATSKKIVQSVYKNYEPLRRTAIAILRRLGINNFTDGKQAATGLLIDMPKLWEEFLHNTVFTQVTGRQERYSQRRYPIIHGARTLEPDFLLEEQRIVFDAKYKSHWGETLAGGTWEGAREDVFQVLAYMGVFNCLYGGVIFPTKRAVHTMPEPVPVEAGRWPGRMFIRIPYKIPETDSAVEFRRSLDQNAAEIVETLKQLVGQASSQIPKTQ